MHQITSLRGVSQQPPFFLLLFFMKALCLWRQFLKSLTPSLLFQTKDCNVMASKLMFLLDDLLWVLTDSQLKAMMKYAESLSEAMEKSAQQRKSLAPESVQVSELGCWSAREKDSFCLCGICIFLDGNSGQCHVDCGLLWGSEVTKGVGFITNKICFPRIREEEYFCWSWKLQGRRDGHIVQCRLHRKDGEYLPLFAQESLKHLPREVHAAGRVADKGFCS